jgi:ornithine decarboxylase
MTMTRGITRFLEEARPATPCLVIDLDIVSRNYETLATHLPLADIFYAVKANPAPEILQLLVRLGCNFDTASRGEIDLCLAAGANPARISFGNTIKKEADIAYAYAHGVRLYAFDSAVELEKLARSAPGSQVFCRILVETEGADWPLSRKFGCDPEMATGLLLAARDLGLDPVGASFHVGSQQTDCTQWEGAIARVSRMFAEVAEQGLILSLINLGGGMPARYREGVPPVEAYAAAINESLIRHFGAVLPRVIVEPGRSMVGDAGALQSEVVLVSRKSEHDDKRWVYLDVGKFNGLAETMDEAIRYNLETSRDGGETGPVIIAGPSCDSADILYEKNTYHLPVDLTPGDFVTILSTGAYTSTYASVGFNGFAPLQTHCISTTAMEMADAAKSIAA